MSILRPVQSNEPVWLSGFSRLDKLSPDLSPCGGPTPYECRPCVKSGASSTCHSDDSGIDATVNVGPQSPLPEDTDDSEDSTSLDGYRVIIPSRQAARIGRPSSIFRPLSARLFHDMPQGVQNIAETAQLSPSGSCCMAASRDLNYYPHGCATGAKPDDNRFEILSYDQLLRLTEILTRRLPVHSRCASFPVIWVRLCDLFEAVRENLAQFGVPFRDIRLNGGAASYVIGMESSPTYNDIDILISVDLSSDPSAIQKVKTSVLDALMRFLPEDDQPSFPSPWPSHSDLLPAMSSGCSKCSSLSQSTETRDRFSPATETYTVPVTTAKESLILRNGFVPEESMDIIPELRMEGLTNLSDPNTSGTSARGSPQPLPVAGTNLDPTTSNSLTLSSSQNSSTRLSPSTTGSLYVSNLQSPPQSLRPHSISPTSSVGLRESYIYKQFRKYGTNDADCWSLLSLGFPSSQSKVVEFKFVDRMRRQFEFTVDSFQILLDPILSFFQSHPDTEMTPNYYPTVVAESVAGSFSLALHHLKNKLILTKEPEMIRGGGLLKYCRLLVNGYQAPNGIDVCSLERYMSSRFFIDFQDLESQKSKIEAFLANHFLNHEFDEKIEFLKTVYRVVSGSTICLMSYERCQTLNLICGILQQLTQHQIEANRRSALSLDWLTERQNLVIDRVYLGTQLFPVISSASPLRYSCCQCGHGSDGTGITYQLSESAGSGLTEPKLSPITVSDSLRASTRDAL
ncbi:Protein FAM46A [Fasciola gigantica]|uniref:polynucleotide adenylyltransferase n=1 Tax=Fasciola gigantica TaxID=46835 RepID=A0A504YU26_FASGI|nr:Protein FAM46A [Fasciola gigantica]